jgi:septum formation protein
VVTFQTLTEETISRYLAAVEVQDKAGGYALQERGEWIVAGVEGSRSNVIGLPVEKLSALLRRRGLMQD